MKKQWKGFIAGVMLALLLVGLLGTAAATIGNQAIEVYYNNIKVTLDGKAVNLVDANGAAVEPFTINGTTYLPVRAVANALGLGVDWDQATATVVLSSQGQEAAPPASAVAGALDLTGNWTQTNSKSTTDYQAMVISGNTMEIYWVSEDEGTRSLYWAGTFTPPTMGGDTYSWISTNDHSKTDMALLASSDDTKAFTYRGGEISYSASAFGSSMTVRMTRH